MANFWRRNSDPVARPSSNAVRIPSETFGFADQFSHSTISSAPRYQVASYPVAHPHASVTAPSTGAGHASISSQRAWTAGDQQMQFPNAPPAFCDPAQPSSNFYPDTASHLVGYPESSQRTLLPEYGSAYHSAYSDASAAFGESATAPGTLSVTAQYGMYGMPTSINDRQHGPQQGYDADRSATYGGNNQYMNAQADFEPSTATHRLLPQLSPNLFPNLGASHAPSLYPNFYASSTSNASPSAQSMHSEPSSALLGTQSPRLPPFVPPLRRHSMDSVHDPISPSSVPALIYDGEAGDEYDDDSESDPPSAVSELARLPYQSTRITDINGPSNWSRSSFDAGYSGTPSAQADRNASQHARSPGGSAEGGSSAVITPQSTSSSERSKPSQKKSKMHQCKVCLKLFPRPSGLATHMNSHSGAKPFKCPIPTCTKSFAVRSNAKRHLRTHGIFPTSDHSSSSQSQFTVGFDTPLVSDVHEVGKLPSKLRWIPQSLSTRTANVEYLRDPPSDSEEEYLRSSCSALPVPLPPVTPPSPTWDSDGRYEERDLYVSAESPYLPNQWRGLPGPAIVSSSSI